MDHQPSTINSVLYGRVSTGLQVTDTQEAAAKTNPQEQEVILFMRRERDRGCSYGRIASSLNALNIPTKRGKGEVIKYKGESRFISRKWQTGNVAKVLNSKTVQAWLAARLNQQAA